MAYLGTFVGGFLIMLLLAILWEKALFSRVLDNPVNGKMLSVLASWLTAGTMAGWGMADGGPYAWRAFLVYAPPAILLAVLAYRRGRQIQEEETSG